MTARDTEPPLPPEEPAPSEAPDNHRKHSGRGPRSPVASSHSGRHADATTDSRVLLRQLAEQDPVGLETLYEEYAEALFDYCAWLLGDRDRASDALHDTLLIAAEKAGQLRNADRLKPWLYSIARNECLRTLRDEKRLVGPPDADLLEDDADMDEGLRANEAVDLVHTSLAALGAREREVVVLALRHQLDVLGIAAAMGVAANHAHALFSRAKGQLEKAVTAVVLTRNAQCQELAEITDGQPLSPLLRKRVNRHVDSCQRCSEAKGTLISPTALLSAVPLMLIAGPLKARALLWAMDPQFVTYRADLVARAGPFTSNGFPPSPPKPRAWQATAVVAGAVALAIAVSAIAFALSGGTEPVASQADAPPPAESQAQAMPDPVTAPPPTEPPTTTDVPEPVPTSAALPTPELAPPESPPSPAAEPPALPQVVPSQPSVNPEAEAPTAPTVWDLLKEFLEWIAAITPLG